jgi:hypothetical protein
VANEVLIASLEDMLRRNREKQKHIGESIQNLEKQSEKQRGDLLRAQQAKDDADREISRVRDAYTALLEYSRSNDHPQELSEEIQRLRHQQSIEYEKSQLFSRHLQAAEGSLQLTERYIEEQQERLKALIEEQQKIDLHVLNVQKENAS